MKDTVVALDRARVACKDCGLAPLCLPVGLAPDDINKLSAIIHTNRVYHRGDLLFRGTDAFSKLFVVKSGSVKTFTEHPESGEQVLGFHLPGELVGLDGIADERYLSSASALETTACCEIPFGQLTKLATQVPSLQHQVYRLLSREIGFEGQMLAVLGRFNAEQRLAAFLLGISNRLKQRGLSATEFRLSMSRSEIGNYLGLAVETISRLFRKFHEQGLVEANRKQVKILAYDLLAHIVDSTDSCCARHA